MHQTASDISPLIQGCLAGQAAAQRSLVQQFAPWLMSVARRYARNKAEAQDILQDAFVHVFNKIGTFNPGKGSFQAWMHRIVINTALMHYRKFHFEHEKGVDILPDTVNISPDIFSKLNFDELIDLISTLPEGARQVFNLSVFDEFSHDEIAEILNIPAGTSRSLLSRARKILQEKIKLQSHELARI